MSRKKNKTTVELQAAADHVDQEIARLQAEKKDLRKQINETARKERNAHLYFRGGELTHHLQDKAELLTDEDIKGNRLNALLERTARYAIVPQKELHRKNRQHDEIL